MTFKWTPGDKGSTYFVPMFPVYFNSFQYFIAIAAEYWKAEHYMRSVHIRSFSGLYSVQIRKNTDRKTWICLNLIINIFSGLYPVQIRKNTDQKTWICSNLTIYITKLTQTAFTCSKLTVETLRQGVKYFQS